MGIKNNLLGLTLSASLMFLGGWGVAYSEKNAENFKDQGYHYQKLLDINEEKRKNNSKDLLPPEKVVDYKNNINEAKKNEYSYNSLSKLPLIVFIAGNAMLWFNVIGFNEINKYKSEKSSSKKSGLEDEVGEEKPKQPKDLEKRGFLGTLKDDLVYNLDGSITDYDTYMEKRYFSEK